ncbi:MAG: zinc-ribbon domain-containing protein, partial [Atribacterota bacterium]
NEWGREKELILDSMIEITQWHQAIAEAKKNYVPEEVVDTMGACPKCGKKMTPDFKLCPYCGCRLS